MLSIFMNEFHAQRIYVQSNGKVRPLKGIKMRKIKLTLSLKKSDNDLPVNFIIPLSV